MNPVIAMITFCCLDYCNLGKTHTMVGTLDNPGLIPRCAAELFKVIDSQHAATTDWKYKILFSYLEIYQEKVITFLLVIQYTSVKRIYTHTFPHR